MNGLNQSQTERAHHGQRIEPRAEAGPFLQWREVRERISAGGPLAVDA